MKKMSLIILSLVSVITIFTTGFSQAANRSTSGQTTAMVAVNGMFDKVLLSETAHDLRQGEVYIDLLIMEATYIDKPNLSGIAGLRSWALTEKDKTGLNRLYQTVMRKQFAKAGYSVVAEIRPGVIVVSAELLALDPYAPKDDARNRPFRELYISNGAGNMTIAIEVKLDDDIIFKIEDRARAGHNWGRNDRFNNRQDVRQLIGQWASKLTRQFNVTSISYVEIGG